MIIEERLKFLRQTLGYTQETFAALLGITRSAYAKYESALSPLTDEVIVNLCMKFHVSEQWLRFGMGETFTETTETIFDKLQASAKMTEDEAWVLRTFIGMPEEERAVLSRWLKNFIDRLTLTKNLP